MWKFPEHVSGMIEDPVQEAFFSDATDNRTAIHLVRESIQNSLDARAGSDPVLIRFTFGVLDPEMTRVLYDRLDGHLRADGNGLRNPPGPVAELRFLAIEDFGTRGLTGDVNRTTIRGATSDDNFFYFFRNVGRSGKGENALGSWGLGKQVFPASSEINTCFGLTCREGDPQSYLMGISVLKHHEIYGRHYTPYGHYAEWRGETPYPITDPDRIAEFRDNFHLRREQHEPGLSVIIPHVVEEFNPQMLEDEVVENYFWPILNGDLVIEIQSNYLTDPETVLNADTMRKVPDEGRIGRELADTIRLAMSISDGDHPPSVSPILKQVNRAPRWEDIEPSESELERLAEAVESDSAFRVSLLVPVQGADGRVTPSPFAVYGRRVNYAVNDRSYFVRGGISIPRACQPNPTDYVFIVESTGQELARMLKTAENPAHSEFTNTAELKQQYTRRAMPTIRFVVSAPREIAKWLEQGQLEEDQGLFSDVFYTVTASETEARKPTRRRRNRVPVIKPPDHKPKRYALRKQSNGFVVRDLQNDTPMPSYIDIRLAYDADVRDPFNDHTTWDFNLKSRDETSLSMTESGCVVERLGPNHLRLVDLEDGFSVRVDGFDVNRDLKARARATTE